MERVRGTELEEFSTARVVQVDEGEFVFEAYKKKKENLMVKISLKGS